jgi:hypothetical protein
VFVLEMPLWILGGAFVAFFIIRWLVGDPKSLFHKYELVKLNVQLGNVGAVEQRPNNEDVQIAHRIWTELMTRKAAQPIDVGHDVIMEICNSCYALFGRVRQLISDIPGHVLRKEKSTQELVRIATQTLNNGLRPHLTVTLSPAAQPASDERLTPMAGHTAEGKQGRTKLRLGQSDQIHAPALASAHFVSARAGCTTGQQLGRESLKESNFAPKKLAILQDTNRCRRRPSVYDPDPYVRAERCESLRLPH